MVLATNLGYPRIGSNRELKKAVEQFWGGKIDETSLLQQAAELRKRHWQLQASLGLQHIPSNDFSLYDQVLDTAVLVGAVPERYHWDGGAVDLGTYFAMARGRQGSQDSGEVVAAMEMTKWFDTNYHYLVPEFAESQSFRLSSSKPFDEFAEAKALGIQTRPVLLGPISFLLLGKTHRSDLSALPLLEQLLPVYEQILGRLAQAGAEWVQIDEPCLVLDLEPETLALYQQTYARLSAVSPALHILLATYFGAPGAALSTVLNLPVAGVHLDLVRAPEQLEQALAEAPASLVLSLGVVDGRNIWRTEFERALEMLERAIQVVGSERVFVAPSCSLLHVPTDLELETGLNAEYKQWLAFANQKLEELVLLARASNQGRTAIAEELDANRRAFDQRRHSTSIHSSAVAQRMQEFSGRATRRPAPFSERRKSQQDHLKLPLLPTTTIGSFPQTPEVRAARAAAAKRGEEGRADYENFLREEITRTIRFQEEIGLDVLVHGESERSDMVEYFGEQLQGFLFTRHGWVQSYGSRCVRPPVIVGDIIRNAPMTVRWSQFAQSVSTHPVKGMLTGPVTILQWSFVRDDQPRSETCMQLALALHDEVLDLEAAGISVIQIDEPAFREGLPLRHADWQQYIDWAVNCFRLTACDVQDATQIHTHMCYAEFDDILDAISDMDADVISLEASRSQLELLNSFTNYRYPNAIGPGVYDIHSPRIPSSQECEDILYTALRVLPADQVWVNPDCGLKTRKWEEVRPALINMVEAAHTVRDSLLQKA